MALLHATVPGAPGLKAPEAVPGSDHTEVPTPTKEGNVTAARRGQKTGSLNLDAINFTNLKFEIWGVYV